MMVERTPCPRISGRPVGHIRSGADRRIVEIRGGPDWSLFIAAAEWHGMEAAMSEGPGFTGRLLAVAGQPAPHAGRP
jgi:hypothetical protein